MKKLYLFCLIAFLLSSKLSFAQYTTLLNFQGTTNGSNPYGSLFSDGTYLYGTTYLGGANNMGTIFKILPDGTGYLKLLDFEGTSNGSVPFGSLISDGTFLYGMTEYGGTNGKGTIFKIMPDGTGYIKLLDFVGGLDGSTSLGSLVYDGTFLYGMTYVGGTNNSGTIFKIKTDGSAYEKLLDFGGTADGRNPYGSLIIDGTALYGMTAFGGANNLGTIFKILTDGSGYLKLMDFDGTTNGSRPDGTLFSDGIYLYGVTGLGGTNDLGSIFKIMPDGTGYLKLKDFAGGIDGSTPLGSLISDGAFLYGTTYEGGLNNLGTIFKILPDGSAFEILLDFAGIPNGRNPNGSLILDGNFLYGTTPSGGTDDIGIVFKYHPPGLGYEQLNSNSITISPNPTTGVINILNSIYGEQFISVTNILGEEVLIKEINFVSNTPYTIDISNKPAGIYFLKVGNCTETIIRM